MFLAEEKALRKEHNDEYNVFIEVPEMHPDYECKYEQFITCYREQTAGAEVDSEMEEKLWTTYWLQELEKVKAAEWSVKRKQLVEKYKKVFQEKKKIVKEAVKVSTENTTPEVVSKSLKSDSVLMQSLAFADDPPQLPQNIIKKSKVTASVPVISVTVTSPLDAISANYSGLNIPTSVTSTSSSATASSSSVEPEIMLLSEIKPSNERGSSSGIAALAQIATLNKTTVCGNHYAKNAVSEKKVVSEQKTTSEQIKFLEKKFTPDKYTAPEKKIPQEKKVIHEHKSFEKQSTSKSRTDGLRVQEIYTLLEELCRDIGILGPALKGLICMARDRGADSKEAMKIFTDSDNITLVKMSIEKLKGLLKESTQESSVKIVKGIAAAEELLKVASQEKSVEENLDMQLIAKATLGKKPAEILDFINSSLAFEGKAATKEELSRMYLTVSSLHLGLAMEQGDSSENVTNSNTLSSQSQNHQTTAGKTTHIGAVEAIPPMVTTSFNQSVATTYDQNTYSKYYQQSSRSNKPPSTYQYAITTTKTSSLTTQSQVYSTPPPDVSSINSKKQVQFIKVAPNRKGTVSDSTSVSNSRSLTDVDKDSSDSWFVQQVKNALIDPGITIEQFNIELATVFAMKPRNYQFSSKDLSLASELQQLGTSGYCGNDFISKLKNILKVNV